MDPMEAVARFVVLMFQTIVFLLLMVFVGGPILLIGSFFGTVGLVIAVFMVIVVALAFIGNLAQKSEE